jgi:vacuolar-type H+-ATPase subunit H
VKLFGRFRQGPVTVGDDDGVHSNIPEDEQPAAQRVDDAKRRADRRISEAVQAQDRFWAEVRHADQVAAGVIKGP